MFLATSEAWRKLAEVKRIVWKEPYAWPGGYDIAIYIDGDRCCNACMRDNWLYIVDTVLHGNSSWGRRGEVLTGVHWEGPSDYCEHCNGELPSEYGDPDSEDSQTG